MAVWSDHFCSVDSDAVELHARVEVWPDENYSIFYRLRIKNSADMYPTTLPMLQEALGDEPCLFVYPQFPAWYFLLRGTPCTRHLMRTYMAATADQAEVIEILDHERPLHILLDAPYEDLEGGVGVAERLPELDRWIRGHHVPGAAESGWQLGQRRVLRRDR